jgi:hypothetical protein
MTTTIEPPQQAPAPAPQAAPAPPAPEQPAGRNLKKIGLIAAAVLAVALLAFFGVRALTGGPDTVSGGSASAPFKVAVPEGWKALPSDKLASMPGKPLGVIQREDGTGFLVVRQDGKAPKSFDAFTKDLDKEFKKRVPDFQKRSTRTLKIKAGGAFFYSYIRKNAGTVHSVVLIPGPKGSYVLNTVAKGGEDQVAKELGRMIVNFDR